MAKRSAYRYQIKVTRGHEEAFANFLQARVDIILNAYNAVAGRRNAPTLPRIEEVEFTTSAVILPIPADDVNVNLVTDVLDCLIFISDEWKEKTILPAPILPH